MLYSQPTAQELYWSEQLRVIRIWRFRSPRRFAPRDDGSGSVGRLYRESGR